MCLSVSKEKANAHGVKVEIVFRGHNTPRYGSKTRKVWLVVQKLREQAIFCFDMRNDMTSSIGSQRRHDSSADG